MAITVYTPEGKAEEKEAVDARECVERCGYSYEPPAPVEIAPAEIAPAEIAPAEIAPVDDKKSKKEPV